LRDVTEDVWLNEARADYASTLLGYDDVYRAVIRAAGKIVFFGSAKSLVEWLNNR